MRRVRRRRWRQHRQRRVQPRSRAAHRQPVAFGPGTAISGGSETEREASPPASRGRRSASWARAHDRAGHLSVGARRPSARQPGGHVRRTGSRRAGGERAPRRLQAIACGVQEPSPQRRTPLHAQPHAPSAAQSVHRGRGAAARGGDRARRRDTVRDRRGAGRPLRALLLPAADRELHPLADGDPRPAADLPAGRARDRRARRRSTPTCASAASRASRRTSASAPTPCCARSSPPSTPSRASSASSSERFSAAYTELEAALYEGRQVAYVIAPLLGLALESDDVPLGEGLSLVRGETLDDAPPEAVWSTPGEVEHGTVLAVLTLGERQARRPAAERRPRPLPQAAERAAAVRRGLLRARAGRLGAARRRPVAGRAARQRRPRARPHDAAVPEQEDELRAFCSLIARRTPRAGEVALGAEPLRARARARRAAGGADRRPAGAARAAGAGGAGERPARAAAGGDLRAAGRARRARRAGRARGRRWSGP